MEVLVAGATGAIGIPLTTMLVAAGHQVTGLTRTDAGAGRLRQLGAATVTADVLDRAGLLRGLAGRRFDAVVHQLTSLTKAPARYRDMAPTNELRTRGTEHLLAVARATGARRYLTQSIVFGYGYRDHGPEPLTELHRFGQLRGDAFDPTVAALAAAEQLAFAAAPDLEAVALRYGLFYGRDVETMAGLLRRRLLPVTSSPSTLALVHHDDAAAATVLALEHGQPGTAYNVVDDTPVTWRDYVTTVAAATGSPRPLRVPARVLQAAAPYAGRMMTEVSMRGSNTLAREHLGWSPRYRSCGEGIAAVGTPASS